VVSAPAIGPVLGGWLTDNLSWHWVFLINLPVGLLSLTLVGWLVVEPERLQRERRERLAKGLNSTSWDDPGRAGLRGVCNPAGSVRVGRRVLLQLYLDAGGDQRRQPGDWWPGSCFTHSRW